MTEVRSSEYLITQVADIIAKRVGIIADTPHGTLFGAPPGGLGRKAIFVAEGENPEQRKKNCLEILTYLRKNGVPVHIWHELLDEEGAIIIDNLNIRQLQLLNTYGDQ